MTHPLVSQLRFTRTEWLRALDGVGDDEARRRFQRMNSIGWMVGHLAWQEQRYWVTFAQGRTIQPRLNELVANGAPASTPPLAEMWDAWRAVTRAADVYLDELTTDQLQATLMRNGKPVFETTGTLLQRTIYHYWYHIGEAQAVRQLLGHTGLPDFVGAIGKEAPYRPERG